MRRHICSFVSVVAILAPSAGFAQSDSTATPAGAPARADLGPPVRRIATACAVCTEPIMSVLSVRELPDGRVLVNDGNRRRLLLMDTTLKTVRVVLDSLAEYSNAYGARPGAMLAYRGDSTLFIDPQSLAMLVISPTGEIARVRSVPRVNEVFQFGNPTNMGYGVPSTDARGRLVYSMWAEPARPATPPPRGVPYFPPQPDSAFVVAMNLDSRKVDTLGAIRIPKFGMTVKVMANGGFNFIEQINPLPGQDEFAVLSDGSVALVRSIDYRIDYLNPDGTWSSSPKLPYDWQPVSDSLKRVIADSVLKVQSRNAHVAYTTALIRWVNLYGKGYPEAFKAPEPYSPPAGFARDWKFPPGVKFPDNYIYGCARGEEPVLTQLSRGDVAAQAAAPPAPATPGVPLGSRASCIPMPIANTNAPAPPTLRDIGVVHHTELPDYRPPLTQGNAVRADADGYLWIRPVQPKPIPGGPVYDVVSRKGELVDRLQLPQGYTIVGFGKGRIVYLTMRDASGLHLARVRLR
ncbi:MAG: hypothetical protein ACRENU_02410 [Gemmatimonadaceae bacterium]